MIYIFWISLIMLLYIYAGYPVYVFLRAKIAPKRTKKDLNYTPLVSVIFSAHNEAAYVKQKIENLMSGDYPSDKIEILAGSDGSTDGTNEALSGISNPAVQAFIFPERRGKVSVLRDLVPKAKGEIIVFCDTRQLFERGAIRHLAANFADKAVGCVSGELMFERDEKNTGISTGVGIYWSYEKLIRSSESRIHSMVGATGAIYAIRRELYSEPPVDTILDDVYIPLSIARRGFRCIVEDNAKAYDKPARLPQEEYRRKVRTLAGNYQIFAVFKGLFRPFNNPMFMPLFAHKFLRVVAPFLMVTMLISNIAVVSGGFYGITLLAQIGFYGLAFIGSLTYRNTNKKIFLKLVSIPYMFCQMNLAAVAGFYRFISGKQNIAWEKSTQRSSHA